MKLHERLLILFVSVTLVVCLYTLYLSQANFETFKAEFGANFEEKSELLKILRIGTNVVAEVTLPKNLGINKIRNPKKVTLMKLKKTTFTSSTSKPRVNKFKDLHKYSVQNPDFRKLMEWPPFVRIPRDNPNLAKLMGQNIYSNSSNWENFNLQISKLYLYEENSTVVEGLLHDMETLKIVLVALVPVGTQLKFYVEFEDGSQALLKPRRYPDDHPNFHLNHLYHSEYERHSSEIAAYHLDKILGFRRVAPTVGRKLNITSELYPLIDDETLLNTFYYSPDGNYCFHGLCPLYCDTHHGFCGNPDTIEVSLTAWMITDPFFILNQHFIPNPWKRSYVFNQMASFETDPYFCYNVARETPPFHEGRRLYDAIDCGIFDYLMGNTDRHHFNEFLVFGRDNTSNLIHIDNGRGFVQPSFDDELILKPLLQCCTVRLSTFNKLYEFHAGPKPLSDLMKESLANDPLSPVLTEPHFQALDRRVDKVLDAIRRCVRPNSPSAVFLDDLI